MAVQSKIEIAVKDDHATVEAERGRSEYSFIISPETAQIGGQICRPSENGFNTRDADRLNGRHIVFSRKSFHGNLTIVGHRKNCSPICRISRQSILVRLVLADILGLARRRHETE